MVLSEGMQSTEIQDQSTEKEEEKEEKEKKPRRENGSGGITQRKDGRFVGR